MRRMMKGRILGTVGVVVLSMVASPVLAQDRMIVIEDSEWVVDLEKPSAYYLLQPSNLNYEEEEPEASFLEELWETVEAEPF